jgi:TolA-binding protein
MRRLAISILVVAAISSAGAAFAQPGLSTGTRLRDGSVAAADNAFRVEQERMRNLENLRKAGLGALQEKDFAGAEKQFAKLLSFDPTTSDASYLMGLAQIGLEKWPEAKVSLEAAVKNEPKRPEPKARLGVAHVMLRDINSAADQHDALSALARECNGCPDQKTINDNLLMLDKVLVAATKPKTAG